MDVRLTNVYIADARLVSEGLVQPEDAMAVFVGRAGKGRSPCSWSAAPTPAPAAGTARPWPCSRPTATSSGAARSRP